MAHWIEINGYRSANDEGFGNAWSTYRCETREVRKHLLTVGLPLDGAWHVDDDGRRSPVLSTMGIRLASRAAIRKALRDEEVHGAKTEVITAASIND